ncbi:deoxycytidylate deaminase isoform X5 [Poecile atricapillus]|uniref:deoxycytidylate deaminase isoform X5 n=1 Tax=Poecile atricapillus TaxID=48891 RepID=UPI002738EE6C|nr:deoxycytidylate deaminase isoform X5 [Poecile atricapillus]
MTDTAASCSLSASLPRPCIGWRRRLCRGACPGPGSAGNAPREKAALPLPPCPESGRCRVLSPSCSGPANLSSHPCELSLKSREEYPRLVTMVQLIEVMTPEGIFSSCHHQGSQTHIFGYWSDKIHMDVDLNHNHCHCYNHLYQCNTSHQKASIF